MELEDLDFKPTEENIIANSKINHLYSHDFGQGKYFQVVFQDEAGFEIKLSSKTMFKVVYIKEKNDISSLEIIKLISGKEKQRLVLSSFNFAQLLAFLKFISSIDLKSVSEQRIRLDDSVIGALDEETKRKLKTLLSNSNGEELIKEILSHEVITSKDIVNIGYRKAQLAIFEESIRLNTWDEKNWQFFFDNNQWIFGYSLSYRFQGILQKEFHASNSNNLDGSNEVIGDFLLGDEHFTTFVELKKTRYQTFCLFKK